MPQANGLGSRMCARFRKISHTSLGSTLLLHGPSFPAHAGARQSPWHPSMAREWWSGPKRPIAERTRRRWHHGSATSQPLHGQWSALLFQQRAAPVQRCSAPARGGAARRSSSPPEAAPKLRPRERGSLPAPPTAQGHVGLILWLACCSCCVADASCRRELQGDPFFYKRGRINANAAIYASRLRTPPPLRGRAPGVSPRMDLPAPFCNFCSYL